MTKEQHSWVTVAEWQGRDTPTPRWDCFGNSLDQVTVLEAELTQHHSQRVGSSCAGPKPAGTGNSWLPALGSLMRQYSSTPTGNLGRDDHSLSSSPTFLPFKTGPGLMLGLQECTLSAYKRKLKENSISNTTKTVTPERGPWTTFHWSGRGFFLKSNKRDHIKQVAIFPFWIFPVNILP